MTKSILPFVLRMAAVALVIWFATPFTVRDCQAEVQATPPTAAATPQASEGLLGKTDFNNAPTYIKADTLTLKSEDRVFVYSGNVEVKQGDMTLTSDILEGRYDDKNQIQQMIARNKVVILKGPTIRAQGERATYERASDTLTLSESPELQQSGSILTADLIKIYLREDRSEALGAVRVKLVDKGDGKGKETSLFK